jgi:amino acid transporter
MTIAVVVGTVIGSGVFRKPQMVALNVENFGLVALAWTLGGLLALLGALSLTEVATLFPQAGGGYVYLRESYGQLAAFLFGWVDFGINRAASLAALASVFTDSLNTILANPEFQRTTGLNLGAQPLPFWHRQGVTVFVIVALALVNARGVRWGGGLQALVTSIKIGSLLTILALPFLALLPWLSSLPAPRAANLTPVWPGTWNGDLLTGFGIALVSVLWAYHGWVGVGPIAEEVRQPQRNIPLGLLGGVGIIIFLYLGANLAYSLILTRQEMMSLKDTSVVEAFGLRMLGPLGGIAASAALMCSVFGALNGNILVGSRLVYAMGEDGLAPRALGAVHARYRTPAVAIMVLSAWSSILVLAVAALTTYSLPVLHLGEWALDLNVPEGKAPFDILSEYVVFGAVLFETLAVSSIFVIRVRRPDAPRSYRCPGYPIVPALYVAIMAIVALHMCIHHRTESVVAVGYIALGAVVYLLWMRRSHRQVTRS